MATKKKANRAKLPPKRLIVNNVPFAKVKPWHGGIKSKNGRKRVYDATIDVVFPDKSHKTISGRYDVKTKASYINQPEYDDSLKLYEQILKTLPSLDDRKGKAPQSAPSHKPPPYTSNKSLEPKKNMYSSSPIDSSHEKASREKVNLSTLPPSNAVYIYANKCHCLECERVFSGSNLVTETVKVQTVAGATVNVVVLRCLTCGKYYMNYLVFKKYSENYGGLLFEFDLDPAITSKYEKWKGFHADSILSRCGYNVQAGTPEKYRHRILAYIIDSEKASKSEIIELISRFIILHQNTHPAACEKWRKDILFVNEYNSQSLISNDTKTFVKGGRISRKL